MKSKCFHCNNCAIHWERWMVDISIHILQWKRLPLIWTIQCTMTRQSLQLLNDSQLVNLLIVTENPEQSLSSTYLLNIPSDVPYYVCWLLCSETVRIQYLSWRWSCLYFFTFYLFIFPVNKFDNKTTLMTKLK